MTPEESPFEIPDYVRTRIAESIGSPLTPIHDAAMWDGIPLRKAGKAPTGSFFGNYAESLDHVPRTARYLSVGGGVDLSALAEMPLEYLRVWKPSDRFLKVFSRLKSVRYLRLGDPSQAAVDAFGSVTTLEAIAVSNARKVDSIRALTELPRLTSLLLDDVRPMSRLDDLASARALKYLMIGGAMWTSMKVDSVAPLGELARLETLQVINVRVVDGSLTPLTRLRHLSELSLPNFFAMEEFARIAVALPNVKKSWLGDGFFGDGGPCKKCGTSRYMTLGTPTKYLCETCDADRLEKHLARWRTLIAAFQ